MNQSYIWAIVVITLVLVAAFYLWRVYYYQPLPVTSESLVEEAEEISQPQVGVVDPVEKLQEINPAEKANPFTKSYANPFK